MHARMLVVTVEVTVAISAVLVVAAVPLVHGGVALLKRTRPCWWRMRMVLVVLVLVLAVVFMATSVGRELVLGVPRCGRRCSRSDGHCLPMLI